MGSVLMNILLARLLNVYSTDFSLMTKIIRRICSTFPASHGEDIGTRYLRSLGTWETIDVIAKLQWHSL